MTDTKTLWYLLTFRCVNCGRSEASARTCLESEAGEDQITGRIYRVTCKSCGWKGEVCGISAVRISHEFELKVME
jgi:transcription elongation factor Elf1